MSDSGSDVEEDERVMKLVTYKGKHSEEELAAHVLHLGGKDAIIYGELFAGREAHGRAHFLIMGAACMDEEKPIAPQIEVRKALFKAVLLEEADQAAFLMMLELFCARECRAALEVFGPLLKVLWERDIVTEELIVAWHGNERALAELYPPFFCLEDAISIRDSSREFIEWVQAGEG